MAVPIPIGYQYTGANICIIGIGMYLSYVDWDTHVQEKVCMCAIIGMIKIKTPKEFNCYLVGYFRSILLVGLSFVIYMQGLLFGYSLFSDFF